ncbi:hypothetical protein Q7P37_010173 [Cladosporium fusiforme]
MATMRYQILARLPRHVAAVNPYKKAYNVRTYAQILHKPEQPTSSAFLDGGALKIRTRGTVVRDVDGRWLRDQCACPECRNSDTAQRKINVFKKPGAGKIVAARETGAEEAQWEVTFEDGHQSRFPSKIFERRSRRSTEQDRNAGPDVNYWQASISSDPPTVQHEDIQKGNGMAEMLMKIRTSGFCFVDNMPATPEASQSLLEQIGPIRNTHYGGFYDFTSDLSSKDTAYTSESLEPHTDTTYFTDAIGLQALHLLSHTDGEGGLSSLVDGFSAARELLQQNPDAYLKLSTTGVWGHASGNEGISIQPAASSTVLNHNRYDSREDSLPFLRQVRWNTADRSGVDASLTKLDDMSSWYDAAEAFDAILSKPENQYWFQLKPGKMLIFDNWRVLHGRSAFTGKRRMCGGYINRDDWISKYRMTNFSKEEVMARTMIP